MTHLTRAEVCRAIQAGDTILVHFDAPTLVSRLIQWGTRGSASHELCCLGGFDIIEANVSGINFTHLTDYMDGTYRLTLKRVRRPLSAAENVKVREFWLGLRGKPYGWGAVLRSGLRIALGRYLRPWAAKPARWALVAERAVLGPSAWPDCSETWVLGIRTVREHTLGAYEPDEVTPNTVLHDSHLDEIARWDAPILVD